MGLSWYFNDFLLLPFGIHEHQNAQREHAQREQVKKKHSIINAN